jgi:hypothetical protein
LLCSVGVRAAVRVQWPNSCLRCLSTSGDFDFGVHGSGFFELRGSPPAGGGGAGRMLMPWTFGACAQC